jgi:hypothetical protein
MCDITAGLTAAVGIGSALMGNASAKAQGEKDRAAALQRQAVEEKYRTDMYKYGNETYAQDVKFGEETLEYQKTEFDRQGRMIDKARAGIEKNYINKVGQLLQQQVEEEIALAFTDEKLNTEGRSARSTAAVKAGDRGFEGASVDAVMDDISRQEGESLTIVDLNRQAGARQKTWEALGLKAESDDRLFNLQTQTYNPSGPIKTPGPAGAVMPAAPLSKPSSGALAINIGTSVLGGLNSAVASKSWNGKPETLGPSIADAFKIKW